MSRVHDHRPAVAVGLALDLIPVGLRDLTACEFVIGVDPVFAGIHRFIDSDTGYAYGDVAHCVWDIHQSHRPASERGVKVILPSNPDYHRNARYGVETVVHELGHVLHLSTDLSYVAAPVSDYAETNHHRRANPGPIRRTRLMPWSTTRTGTNPKYRTKAHRDGRARLLAAYQPGDPCCLCGHAMWPPTSALHADHDPLNPEHYRGLAHGTTPCQDCGVKCNVADGSRRGRRRIGQPLNASRFAL